MNPEIINVTLDKKIKKKSYPIFIGKDLLINSGNLLKQYIFNKKIIIVYDNYFSKIGGFNNHLDTFYKSIKKEADSLNLVGIDGGDKSKTMFQATNLVEEILSFEIDRDTVIIAFGGGVIGDITGFAASILLRGLEFIQVPTTLLSQVDSSVGGKTGVNGSLGKNLIGSFHQPLAVIADTSVLKSLPDRELKAGFAEIVKYGLINDKIFFSWLTKNYLRILDRNEDILKNAILKSCSIKANIIKNDEKETGNRALLNLGHTFAHAIESFGDHDGRIIHGEAVAIGICMAFNFSCKLGFCVKKDADQVVNLFNVSGLPTSLLHFPNLNIKTSAMMDKFKYDKKTKKNQLTFILNNKIGESFIKNDIDLLALENFINDEI
jgi:3-dehydroquinate synthase